MASKKTKEKLPSNVLELGNGDKIYFAEVMKGKHYLALQKTVSRAIKSKPVISDDGQVVSKTEVDMEMYQEEVINVFPYLVDKIIDKDGNEKEASVEYYMESDFDDARTIYTFVFRLIAENQAGKVKKN